jgi:hypothetical protein
VTKLQADLAAALNDKELGDAREAKLQSDLVAAEARAAEIEAEASRVCACACARDGGVVRCGAARS